MIIFWSFSSYAQNIQFHHLNEKLGITIRETNDICSDYNGFIWVSSKMGILRVTEDSYKVYSLPYESTDVISVRLIYTNKVIYAYTNNGQIFRYDPVYDEFFLEFNMFRELNNPYLSVISVLADERQRLWLSTTDGFFKYENGQLEADKNYTSWIQSIEWYARDMMWIAKTSEICIYDLVSLEEEDISVKLPFDFLRISCLYYDQGSSRLWIGTMAEGIYYYDPGGTLIQLKNIPRQPVQAIELVNDSMIMAGIDGQGLWAIDRESAEIVASYKENADDPASIKGNGIYDIYCDSNNRVWIATYSGGVSFFDQETPLIKQYTHIVNNPNSLVNNNVNDIIEDVDGKLWFATNNGISCFDPAKNHWKTFNPNKKGDAQVFTSLCEDQGNGIWAGTYSSGVYLVDQKTVKELEHFTSEGSGFQGITNFVFSILEDRDGDIWIGGVQGNLVCYLQKEKIFRPYAFLPIIVMAEFTPGKILAGCSFGLVQIDKISGETETLLEGYLVHDILITDKYLWLCTSGDGLLRFDPSDRTIKTYTTDDGLISNYVNSIVDAGDYLWLGTEAGLCRFDPVSDNISFFPSEVPLTNQSFNSNAHFVLQNGELIWGTNNGTVQFDPSSIQEIRPEGKIFFQDLIVSGSSIRDLPDNGLLSPIDSLENLRLSYKQNTITMELISLGSSARGSKYSWQLEGLDQSWSIPSGNSSLSYTNLPSGNFTLRIRLLDSSMSKVIDERSLSIHITPPFWDRWWFKLLVIFIIVGLIGFTFYEYMRYLRKQQSDQKIRFFANVAHDIRSSVTLINSPVEELKKETRLSEQGRYYLNLAIEQSRRLAKVVTQIMDYQKADVGKEEISLAMYDLVRVLKLRIQAFQSLASAKNIKIDFQSDYEEYLAGFDLDKIENVIDNLVSNAIKYSPSEGRIDIELQASESKWTLKVRDEGIGISRSSQRSLFKEFYRGENAINSKIVGSGIGLVLAKKYVQLHGGKISCTSAENEGSLFQVIIPYWKTDKEGSIGEAGLEDEYSINTSPPQVSMVGEHDAGRQKQQKILVAEDHDELRNFLQTSLDREYVVLTARNGDEAWELILKQMPDLIISDIMMPGMDGFELCRLLKSTYDTSHIPVILLTSLSGKADELQGLGLGADDYLTKPFDVTLLNQRIKTILKNRGLVREKAMKIFHLDIVEEAVLPNELNDAFVKKMMEVVKMNISNPEFGKDHFAAEMNVSPSLLYKKSKALIDQSPTDFIKAVKMDHALSLIKENKYTITEVSILCGFSSIGYFSTVFKGYFGKSPSEILDPR